MTRPSEPEETTRGGMRHALRWRGRMAGLEYDVGIQVMALSDGGPESAVPSAFRDGDPRAIAGVREVAVVAAPDDAGRSEADPRAGGASPSDAPPREGEGA